MGWGAPNSGICLHVVVLNLKKEQGLPYYLTLPYRDGYTIMTQLSEPRFS